MRFSLFFFSSREPDAGPRYAQVLELVRHADETGFDAVWMPERHMVDFGALYPNPATVSAGLAIMTKHVQLRAGSVVLPLHHPLRVCEEWSVVDNLSGGRVGVSFASGWHPDDFVLAPHSYEERRDRMFQAIDVVRRLWRGEDVMMSGPGEREVRVTLRPRPVQPELPIWVTSGGSPGTIERAASIGANLLIAAIGQPLSRIGDLLAQYRRAWPKDRKPRGSVTLMFHTFVAEDDRSMRSLIRGPLLEYLRDFLDQKDRGLTGRQQEDAATFAFERYARSNALLGPPAHCIEILEEVEGYGVDEVACLVDFGVPREPLFDSLNRLAAVRERFGVEGF